MKRIKIGKYEYDTKTTQLGKSFNEIKIPKGAELWDYKDCIKLHNNKKHREQLNLEDCWFFIKQPFKLNKREGFIAWFIAGSDRADLFCGRIPQDSYSGLGVRFKRSLK